MFPLRVLACGLPVLSKDYHNYHPKIHSCVMLKVCACSKTIYTRLMTELNELARVDGTLTAVFIDLLHKIPRNQETTKAYHP